MDIELMIKNYRCFPDSKPARIVLRKGFTSFVGVNNAGKSSLLKFFYEFRLFFEVLSSPSSTVANSFQGKRQGFGGFSKSVLDPHEVFSNLNDRNLEIEFRFLPTDNVENSSTNYPDRVVFTITRGALSFVGKIYQDKEIDSSQLKLVQNTLQGGGYQIDLSPLFQVCLKLSKTLYIGAFRNTINVGAESDYYDIQVGQAFITTWRANKTGMKKERNEATYKLTNDIKHIFGFKDLEINPSEDNKSLQIFIDGKSYWISELGSGLTQFILVLANAVVKKPSYILIDEPELNLHPSLQLDFLTTLGSYASEGVFFATHSLGLARAGSDFIYTVQKNASGDSEVTALEATPRMSELLGELSFSGYRELGFDKVLLVEGVTDIKTVQQFLRQYNKDHKVVLIQLGGSSLINGTREAELEEIKRISSNIYALIDSERAAKDAQLSPDRYGFKKVCDKIGIKCCILKYRAIENYFTDEAVKRVKGDQYKALEPYQKLTTLSPVWAKEENWRIAREMKIEDLNETDLGPFLSSL